MLAQARENLRLDTRVEEALSTDASFFLVPTPSLPNGCFSTEYLLPAVTGLGRALARAGKRDHLIVCLSTTTPGDLEGLIIPALESATGWKVNEGFRVCYNPEFVALGNVLSGLRRPDVVLIGESDPAAGAALAEFYRHFTVGTPYIARMDLAGAEIAKIALNSFITLKISFANQVRHLAATFPSANVQSILSAIGRDSRVGQKALGPGLSYGGPCFPRDNRMLAAIARRRGVPAPLAEAADAVNESTKRALFDEVAAAAGAGARVLVLGLTYKPGTPVIEESAGFDLARRLAASGRIVLVHDPYASAVEQAEREGFEALGALTDLDARHDLAVAVVCCPHAAYATLRLSAGTRLISHWPTSRAATA